MTNKERRPGMGNGRIRRDEEGRGGVYLRYKISAKQNLLVLILPVQYSTVQYSTVKYRISRCQCYEDN